MQVCQKPKYKVIASLLYSKVQKFQEQLSSLCYLSPYPACDQARKMWWGFLGVVVFLVVVCSDAFYSVCLTEGN